METSSQNPLLHTGFLLKILTYQLLNDVVCESVYKNQMHVLTGKCN